jgi:hypothetical protein
MHGHLGLPFGDHDSQIAITLRTRASQVLCHTITSVKERSWTLPIGGRNAGGRVVAGIVDEP